MKQFVGVCAVLVVTTLVIGCSQEATDEDCRDDYRCVELGETGNFMSKNPADPCPCE